VKTQWPNGLRELVEKGLAPAALLAALGGRLRCRPRLAFQSVVQADRHLASYMGCS